MRFQDLLAYKKSFSLAMKIFEITKTLPKEETYSLTDQIRRHREAYQSQLLKRIGREFIPNIFIVN